MKQVLSLLCFKDEEIEAQRSGVTCPGHAVNRSTVEVQPGQARSRARTLHRWARSPGGREQRLRARAASIPAVPTWKTELATEQGWGLESSSKYHLGIPTIASGPMPLGQREVAWQKGGLEGGYKKQQEDKGF